MATTCNLSGLGDYIPSEQNPWNEDRIKHFYRRFAFGATPTIVQESLEQNPSEIIDGLIDKAIDLPITPDPGWGFLDDAESFDFVGTDQWVIFLRGQFSHLVFEDLRKDHIRGRMTMFMLELFVSRWDINMSYMYQSYITKQKYALGNFKDFIHDMGLNGSMLRYLNNYENNVKSPNENYARELFELFTLGVDNGYTEEDIKESARAFTGYNTEKTLGGIIEFDEVNFDTGEKTIFGQTGNWGYSDVIDILFEQKSDLIANYICTKLYQYFVSFTVNEDIVNEMAQTFLDNKFEFAPVLKQLFKSNHFFDEACIGVLIKSPLDLVILHENELSYQVQPKDEGFSSTNELYSSSAMIALDMNLIAPPNVSGWIKHKAWINSISVSKRVSVMKVFSEVQYHYTISVGAETYTKIAKDLFELEESPEIVARGIVDFCLSKKLTNEADYLEAISVFKGGVPQNYFTDGTWDLDYDRLNLQVKNLLDFILTLPEFQLK